MSKSKQNRQRKTRKQRIINSTHQQKSRKWSILLIPILWGISCIILTFFTVHTIADAFLLTRYVPVSQTSVVTSSTPVEHDNNGNITSAPSPKTGTTQTTVYDAWNRPVKVCDENGNVLVQYEYNGLGQRVAAIANGVRTEYHYNENWQELESRTGTEITTNVWGQRHIDDLVCREQNGQRFYSLPDPNWNVVATANPMGVVQERINYSAFGNPTFHEPDMTQKTASDFAWNRTFTGQTYDTRTGIMHYRRRDYDPAMGRFINRDPIDYDAEDVNLYRYVNNSPIIHQDPMGEVVETIWDIANIGIGLSEVGCDICKIVSTGEGWKDLGLDSGGVALDVVATAFPFIPGGAGAANKCRKVVCNIVKRLSPADAKNVAKAGGWKKLNERSRHGETIYDRGKGAEPRYVSYDKDGHCGGTWKGANNPKDIDNPNKRTGTYSDDGNGNINRIGD
ncbi:MAG: toxin C-terminal domain-containing protein [Planctomycetaceae bacterium]|jgi:RHS repeat-associated protein|nr:toxin C-terminal domain-containing protein [Planctomycetaceae bacterium]